VKRIAGLCAVTVALSVSPFIPSQELEAVSFSGNGFSHDAPAISPRHLETPVAEDAIKLAGTSDIAAILIDNPALLYSLMDSNPIDNFPGSPEADNHEGFTLDLQVLDSACAGWVMNES